jgi:ubiquinone/menaquinone biosynthesis C-methylase UbiE
VIPASPEEEAIRVHSEQASLFKDRYDALPADPYGSSFAYSRHRLQQSLDRLLPQAASGARLLDLGCGTGHHMKWARGRGYEAAGTDGSESMLAEAHRLNPSSELHLAPADAVPLPDGSFDAVLCIEVLRYLPRIDPCLREMSRVSKPGGVCLATASPLLNLNGFPVLNRLAQWVPGVRAVRLKQFFHTSVGLERSFRRAGFREVTVHGVYFGLGNWIERLRPGSLAGFLRAFEPLDGAVSDVPLLRDLSGMLLVHAIR